MRPVPDQLVEPVPDRSYLVFCPEHGGWHTAEWWTVDGPGRWVLVWDVAVELPAVSHVMDVPPDALDASAVIRWAVTRRVGHGNA